MRKHHHLPIGAFTVILFILITPVLIFIFHKPQPVSHSQITHPGLETKKNEAKELPEEFKKQVTLSSPSATFRVPILMYHYVENVQNKKDKLRVELAIAPSVFDEQVKTLSDAGYTFMTAKDLGDVLDGKAQLPPKPILLTFDDGHWDFATDVLPILKKYHAKATAYVIPGFIGGSDFMTADELQTVVKSGLVDVGAHTVHHLSLKGQVGSVVQYEVDESKKMLEDEYHIKVVSFAYPYGTFDQQAVQIVKNGGFTTGMSTAPGIEQNQTNRFFLYRIRPGARTGQTLLTLLDQNKFVAF
jgi:peptidoglycan/xylan/chitin deacetylase (PgdA/CDA1 family)